MTEELCKNCQHFKPKGLTIDRNTWGLCKNFNIKGKPGVFRWGDACCINFKPKKEMSDLQGITDRS